MFLLLPFGTPLCLCGLSEWRYSKISPETTWEAVGTLSAFLPAAHSFILCTVCFCPRSKPKCCPWCIFTCGLGFMVYPPLVTFAFSSVQFSRSVVSDSLWPHEPQPARPPCPSPTPGVHPNPCPLSLAIQPSHPLSSPSPPAPNLSQHQGLFQWVSSSHQVAKVLEFQLQHQSFQWTLRTDLLLINSSSFTLGFSCLNYIFCASRLGEFPSSAFWIWYKKYSACGSSLA